MAQSDDVRIADICSAPSDHLCPPDGEAVEHGQRCPERRAYHLFTIGSAYLP
jgi:hypothetical protein